MRYWYPTHRKRGLDVIPINAVGHILLDNKNAACGIALQSAGVAYELNMPGRKLCPACLEKRDGPSVMTRRKQREYEERQRLEAWNTAARQFVN